MATKKKTVKKKPAKKAAKKTATKAPKQLRKLLQKDEPLPWRLENEKGKADILLICDHASNRVPKALKDLGLKKTDLKKHIGYDIGAEDATLHLARVLDAPAIVAQYSRLVTDLNRSTDRMDSMMPEVSDHVAIPGNKALSPKAREQRLKEIFWPYQKKITSLVDRMTRNGRVPFIFCIHSMTDVMDGFRRPWHLAILWNNEEKIAKRVVQNLRRNHPDILVGENEPYSLLSPKSKGSTIFRHAIDRGLPHIFVEFRQDLVATKADAAKWAGLFLEAVRPVLEDPTTFAGRKPKPAKKK